MIDADELQRLRECEAIVQELSGWLKDSKEATGLIKITHTGDTGKRILAAAKPKPEEYEHDYHVRIFTDSPEPLGPVTLETLLEGGKVIIGEHPIKLATVIPAPFPGEPAPIPIVTRCPSCTWVHVSCTWVHVDDGEWATRSHKTHLCEKCGWKWRPANVPTVGVSSPSSELGSTSQVTADPESGATRNDPVYEAGRDMMMDALIKVFGPCEHGKQGWSCEGCRSAKVSGTVVKAEMDGDALPSAGRSATSHVAGRSPWPLSVGARADSRLVFRIVDGQLMFVQVGPFHGLAPLDDEDKRRLLSTLASDACDEDMAAIIVREIEKRWGLGMKYLLSVIRKGRPGTLAEASLHNMLDAARRSKA